MLRPPCATCAGGSQSRRGATVVAVSPGGVQAALIPYPTAKAYLSRQPLVRHLISHGATLVSLACLPLCFLV